MMSVTAKVAMANISAPAIGIAGAAFGKWAGFNLVEFFVFAALLGVSIAAGALALYSEIETRPGVSAEDVARSRRRMKFRFSAQYLIGMTFVYQTDAAPWAVVMAGLVLGGGPVIVRMITDLRKVMSGDDPPGGNSK